MILKFSRLRCPIEGIDLWGAVHKRWSFVVAADKLCATASFKEMADNAQVEYIGKEFPSVQSAVEACNQVAAEL